MASVFGSRDLRPLGALAQSARFLCFFLACRGAPPPRTPPGRAFGDTDGHRTDTERTKVDLARSTQVDLGFILRSK